MTQTEVLIIVLGVVLFVFIWVVLRSFLKNKSTGPFDRQEIKEQWKKVTEILKNPQEMNCKLAIVEADKMLDSLLITLECKGKDMEERLEYAILRYPKLKRAVWAHKLRKEVTAEDYHIKYSVTQKVLSVFKQAYKDLGAL
jgi:hypothetical protein